MVYRAALNDIPSSEIPLNGIPLNGIPFNHSMVFGPFNGIIMTGIPFNCEEHFFQWYFDRYIVI